MATVPAVRSDQPDTYVRTSVFMGVAGTLGLLAAKGLSALGVALGFTVPFFYPFLVWTLFLFAGLRLARGTDRPLGGLWWVAPFAAAAGLATAQAPGPAAALALGLPFGLAMAAGGDETVARRAVTVITVTGFAFLGIALFGAFRTLPALTAVFNQTLLESLLGGVCGFCLAAGAAPRYARLPVGDPVEIEYRRIAGLLKGELRNHVQQSMTVYRNIRKTLTAERNLPEGDFADMEDNLQEIMLDTFRLARQWQEVESYLGTLDLTALRKRILEVEEKLETTRDAFTRDQYEKIRASLEGRLEQYGRLKTAKERVMSRLTYYLTSLEDLHLGVIKLKSSNTQMDALALSALFDTMESLSKDMEATARTLEDLNFNAPPEPRTGAAALPSEVPSRPDEAIGSPPAPAREDGSPSPDVTRGEKDSSETD